MGVKPLCCIKLSGRAFLLERELSDSSPVRSAKMAHGKTSCVQVMGPLIEIKERLQTRGANYLLIAWALQARMEEKN